MHALPPAPAIRYVHPAVLIPLAAPLHRKQVDTRPGREIEFSRACNLT